MCRAPLEKGMSSLELTMSLPISGPVQNVQKNNVNGVGSFLQIRNRRKQARPYNLVLPYEAHHGRTRSFSTSGTWSWHMSPYTKYGDASANYSINTGVGPVGARGFWPGDPLVDYAIGRARSKFISKLQDNRADWATSLIQRQQALDMVASRALQLLGAARALRKGGTKAFTRALGLSVSGKRVSSKPRTSAKSFASSWLEFSYGWSPLVQDIGNSVSLLESPYPGSRISKSCRVSERTHAARKYGTYGDTQARSSDRVVAARCAAYVAIDNPNLFLASQLGFTNPATVAWEVVPFSFVVDWFVNVGDFLESFSAFHGVTFRDAFTSYKCEEHVTFAENHPNVTHIDPFSQWGSVIVGSEVVSAYRSVGIPSAKLGMRKGGFLNPTRAANAISLLVTQGLR
nr:MAG: maturation protein [Hangzhou fiers-like virus 5]